MVSGTVTDQVFWTSPSREWSAEESVARLVRFRVRAADAPDAPWREATWLEVREELIRLLWIRSHNHEAAYEAERDS